MKIRLWKLGSLEHRITPGPLAFEKLTEALLNAGDARSLDLIWDDSLRVEVIDTGDDPLNVAVPDGYVPGPELAARIREMIEAEAQSQE